MRYEILLLSVALALPSKVIAGSLSMAEWCEYLGRDYPLTPQASLTDADAEITLLLMQAASRLDADLADPYLWQFDMLTALGRAEEAQNVLAAYVRLRPDDVTAYLQWVALSVDSLQTAEARAKQCRTMLERSALPGPVSSDLHRRLAEFHWNRGERAEALKEAEAAVSAYEFNFAARVLIDKFQDRLSDRVSRLKRDLIALKANPGNLPLAIGIGDRLFQWGMKELATRCYRHAMRLYELLPPETINEHLVLTRLARQCGKPEVAREQIAKAEEDAKAILATGSELDPAVVAELAWFFSRYDPRPAQAEKLARSAIADRPELVVACRALGSALRQLGRLDEAKEVLMPVVETDVWAAIELAQVLYAGQDTERGVKQLRAVATQPAGIEEHEAITRLVSKWQVAMPTGQAAPAEVRPLLDAFPWEILEYPLAPSQFLSVRLRIAQETLLPGEPWRCTVQLTNTGSFPITLGQEMMVTPEVLASVDTRGDRSRSSGAIIRISLNRAMQLAPSQSIEVTQAIDLGPIRSAMIGTPRVTHDVELVAVLSPIGQMTADGHEMWAPAVGGIAVEPLRFRRVALEIGSDQLGVLMQRSQAGNVVDRIVATEQLAMLLAEHQHLAAKRLDYIVDPIDAKAVQKAVIARVADRDWQVRARVAECMRWFLLDKDATQAATRLLSDQHWLVRGLAMRMFADQYRDKFQGVLKKAADADPDEWVKRVAGALLARVQAATRSAEGSDGSESGAGANTGSVDRSFAGSLFP